jgi:hypothetical protein
MNGTQSLPKLVLAPYKIVVVIAQSLVRPLRGLKLRLPLLDPRSPPVNAITECLLNVH